MDVGIDKGKIVAISPIVDGHASRVIDAEGRVLIPGVIEGDLHLDKANQKT